MNEKSNKVDIDEVDWDSIPPTYSPLFDSFREPKGTRSLLPLESYLGKDAEHALQTVNILAKDLGFKVKWVLKLNMH